IDHLVKTFRGQYGVDLSKDKMAMQRLREAAEKAKIELSAATTTSINLPYITGGGESGPLHLDVQLSRSEFQRMTQDLLDRCKGPFEQAIKDAGVKLADIDHVILVFQAEREIAAYNKKLGTFELTGLPPAPRGVPQIEVTFDIDANGIVHVNAKDLGTGKEQSMTITGGSALPKDDIERMMRDAQEHADEDKRRREEAETRNLAEQLQWQTEKFLAES